MSTDEAGKPVEPSREAAVARGAEVPGADWRGWMRDPVHLMYVLFMATWIIRMTFLAVPSELSVDEYWADRALSQSDAMPFVETGNWAHKWWIIEELSQGGRILWIVFNLLVGSLAPADAGAIGLPMGRALYEWMGLAGMLALMGAARNLLGRRGLFTALVLATLSPFYTNYVVRLLGTMPSVMWVMIAMWIFTWPEWSWRQWGLAGLCLGLSFATHYGTGPFLIALAGGLLVPVIGRIFRRGATMGSRFADGLAKPLFGAVVSAAPLVALEAWARYAGSSYVKRLSGNHENFALPEYGPYGYWVRMLLELDPILQVLAVFLLLSLIFGRETKPWTRLVALLSGGALGTLVWMSVDTEYLRSVTSLTIFGGLGVWHWASAVRQGQATPPAIAAWDRDPPVRMHWNDRPLSIAAVYLTWLAVAAGFTYGRPVSSVCRWVFTAWPLTILLFSHAACVAWGRLTIRNVARMAAPGMIVFAGAVVFLAHAKAREYRYQQFLRTHGDISGRLFYGDFVFGASYAPLANRLNDNLIVFAPLNWLYPADVYEEEPSKLYKIRRDLREKELDHLLSAEQVVYSHIFFDAHVGEIEALKKPPGVPLIPEWTAATGLDGNPVQPKRNKHWGLEVILRDPAEEPLERTATLDLQMKTEPGTERKFGFDYAMIGQFMPEEATAAMEVRYKGALLGETTVPINSRWTWSYQQFEAMFTPEEENPVLAITLKFKQPQKGGWPAVGFYVKEAYVSKGDPKAYEGITSGFAQLVSADEQIPYRVFHAVETNMAVQRANRAADGGSIVRWISAPWSGKRENPIVFAGGAQYAPRCVLRVNGGIPIEFSLTDPPRNRTWHGPDGSRLDYLYLGFYSGQHGLFILRLPDGSQPADQPLNLEVEVTGSDHPAAWFGLPTMELPAKYLPRNFDITKDEPLEAQP